MAFGKSRKSLAGASATSSKGPQARGANPFEADVFGIPSSGQVLVSDLTTFDPAGRRPIEHSRFTWPQGAVRPIED
jgi:hypothetical protein